MIKILITAMLFLSLPETPASLQRKAIEEHKNIVVYFCGSDWCTICHHFKNRVLNDTAVDALLQKNFIFYTADFPQRKKLPGDVVKTNEALAEKLNGEGTFPKLVVTDENYSIKAVVPTDASAEKALEILNNSIK